MTIRPIVPQETQTVLMPPEPTGAFEGWGIRIG